MKTNLKKVFALIFAVMFVFCFAACGEKKPRSSASASTASTKAWITAGRAFCRG